MADQGRYDGFISYAHAADDVVAPRLQAGLHRFAKPWWKRQVLRIFRDESSLSANPHLWSSITDAMDHSDWMVVLLSPEAAASEWVEKEVAWWLEHKPAHRILPVVTEGGFEWVGERIVSDAVPPSLVDAFEEEPRWVDLRFAHSDEQLDLKNPRFASAVGDLASAIRGVPRDELESEEIRQHRRTLRTAWFAAALLTLLAVVASWFGVQARISEREAIDALALSRANELSLHSAQQLALDPELALLLAVAAFEEGAVLGDRAPEAPIVAIRRALLEHRVVLRLEGGHMVAFHPDGQHVVLVVDDNLALFDSETGEEVAVFESPEGRSPWKPTFSPDGSWLAAGLSPVSIADAGVPVVAMVWDVATGEPILVVDGEGETSGHVSLDGGGRLALSLGAEVLVYDVEAGVVSTRVAAEESSTLGSASFSPDGRLLAVFEAGSGSGLVVLFDAGTGEEVGTLSSEAGWAIDLRFSPGGDLLSVTQQIPGLVEVFDVATAERVWTLWTSAQPVGVGWHPDGDRLAIAGNRGTVHIHEVGTDDPVRTLPGSGGGVWGLDFSPDGSRLAGAEGFAEASLIWDVTGGGLGEVGAVATSYQAFTGFGVRYIDEETVALVGWGAHDGQMGTEGRVAVFDLSEGQVVNDMGGNRTGFMLFPRPFPEARLLATLPTDGHAQLIDVDTWEPIADVPPGYQVLAVSSDRSKAVLSAAEPLPVAPDGPVSVVAEVGTWEVIHDFGEPIHVASFDPSGRLVSAVGLGYNSGAGVIDLDGGEPLWWRYPDETTWIELGFSHGGSLLAVTTTDSEVGIVDVDAVSAGTPPEDALRWLVQAHEGWLGVNLVWSPDDSLIATFGSDDRHIKVWSVADGSLVADMGSGSMHQWEGYDFSPDSRQLLVGIEGTLRLHTLDPDELVETAQSRLTRGFTPDECVQFLVDPCPTLEDLQGR